MRSVYKIPIKATNISGKRIRQARIKLGLAQADLAASLHVAAGIQIDQSDISEIERGTRPVKDYELDAISRILKVNPLWLLRGTNEA